MGTCSIIKTSEVGVPRRKIESDFPLRGARGSVELRILRDAYHHSSGVSKRWGELTRNAYGDWVVMTANGSVIRVDMDSSGPLEMGRMASYYPRQLNDYQSVMAAQVTMRKDWEFYEKAG